MKKILAALLAASMLTLGSCQKDGISLGQIETNSNANIKVFEYGSSSIKSGLYGYILSEEKTSYLYYSKEYSEYISGSHVADTNSFWQSKSSDGKTFGELLTNNVNNFCKELVVVKEMADKVGVKVTNKKDLDTIDTIIDDLIADHGKEYDLDVFLYKYGIKTDDLRSYYNNVFLIDALRDYYYGENGSLKIADTEILKAFFENYAKISYIYVKYNTAGATNAEIKQKAEKLLDDIKNGKEKFDDHIKDSEDKNSTAIIGKTDVYEDFSKAVFSAKTGEYAFSEDSSGVYIIRREELKESDITDYYDTINEALASDAFEKYVREYYDKVIVNNTELDKFDIATADTFD